MLLIINYFSLIFCTTLIYSKFINYSLSIKKHIMIITSNLIIALLSFYLNAHAPYVALFCIIILSFQLNKFLYKTPLELTLTLTIISYGISYILLSFSIIIISFCTITFSDVLVYFNNRFFIRVLSLILHIFFSRFIFKSKRAKNSLLMLYNTLNSTTLMFISIICLFIYLIMSNAEQDSLFISLYFIAFFLALFFYISWRNSLTRTYNDKRRDRDIDILTEHIEELEEEYKKLAEDKDELAKIVHRDNKLVPAMLLSVESFLTEFSDASPEMKARGQELMAELNKEAESRKGILNQQDQKCTAKLISTGIPYLDSVLTYMQEKAMSKDIVLSASGDPGIADLVARTIEEEDLKTLAADMLENAIIANTYNHGSNVYFVIGYFGKHLAIYVYDSGIPFTKEVLLDLGIQKHTTHEADGGSGIGLMTIFELVRKYRATYIIDEYSTPTGPYTKRITIVFDKRRKYILNTSRPKEEIDFLRQRADLIIESRKEPHIK